MSEDPAILILMPYRSHTEIGLYPDSRVLKANCGHYAWLSPTGEAYVDTAYTCCLDCGEDVFDESTNKVAVAGAMDAVRAWHGDDGVAQARAYMQMLGIREVDRD